MEIKFNLAGMIHRIRGPEAELFPNPGVLEPFLGDWERVDREVTCGIVDQFPEPDGECVYHNAGRWVYRYQDSVITYMGSVQETPANAYIRAERQGNTTDIRVLRSALPDRIPAKTILQGLEAEHLIVRGRGFLFHCSYIEYRGSAILFTAPSGVGKSTQAELWRRYRGAEIINGDRAAVCLTEQGFEARGIPFSGSSGISHDRSLPLKAIVCLSQAPETTIRPLTGVRAFRLLWEGVSVYTWDREDVALCSETVMKTLEQVPVFHLACTPDESAVLALEKALAQIRR